MISKRIPMKSAEKSSIRRLINYLVSDEGKSDRVSEINISNCHSEDLTWATREMLSTQRQNTRATSDKTYHLLISFSPEEEKLLDYEKIKEIERRFCKELGFEEHQRVAVLHRDTDNLHVQIAINKIHPTKYTLHEPYNDYYKRHKLAQKLEIEFGLASSSVKAKKNEIGLRMPEKAAAMEHVAGEESLVGYVRRLVQDKIDDIKSWEELHSLLSEKGVILKERGNGLVVESGGYMAKASSCLRSMSKVALEKRFGSFKQPENIEAVNKGYKPRPLQAGSDELYQKYQAERAVFAEMQNTKLATAWAECRQQRDAALREYKQQKNIVFLTTSRGGMRKMMLAGHKIRFEARKKRSLESYQQEKFKIYRDTRLMSWNDWLMKQAEKGDREALETLKKRKPQTIALSLKTKPNPYITPYEQYRSNSAGGAVTLVKQLVRRFAALYQSSSRTAWPSGPPKPVSSVRNLSGINVVSERKLTTMFLQQNAHDCLAEDGAADSKVRWTGIRHYGNAKGYVTRGGDVRGIIAEKQVAIRVQELER